MYNGRICLKNQEEDTFKRVKLLLYFTVWNLTCTLLSSMQFFEILFRDSSPKKSLSVIFTHSHVIPKLYDRLSPAEHKINYFE